MEIELKLALLPRHTARIRRHSLLKNITPERHPLLSIYFDTPTFDLMQRGIALRLRRVGDQWIQTLKAEAQSVGAMSSRPEWEMPVTPGNRPDFQMLPETAMNLLAGIKLNCVAPVFTTEFHRTTWQVVNPSGHAEVALDTGKIYAGESCRNICEVEIELKSGPPQLLFKIATQLLQQVPLHVEPRSKAERGYLISGATSPLPMKSAHAAVHKNQTPGEAWNAIVREALVQTVSNVPGFLESAQDIEYLHQLRVALRRLQTSVELAKSMGQMTPDWNQALRESMRTLNAARDWDVFVQDTLPTLLAKLQGSPENILSDDAVLVALTDVAMLARQRAQAHLRKPAFTQLILDVGRSLLVTSSDVHQRNVKARTEEILERRWQTLRKLCHGFTKLNSTERHKVRIAAKKMRYTMEAFAPLYGGQRSDQFINALATLQDQLGYENDLRIGKQLLRSFPKRSLALNFELGRICGAMELESAQHAPLSGKLWKRLARSELFWR